MVAKLFERLAGRCHSQTHAQAPRRASMLKLTFHPLYRRGPDLAHPIRSAQWPRHTHAPYGPPDDLWLARDAARREFDYRLFSLYFLVAETLATYLAYRIAQHCLRGCRVEFLSPAARMAIGVLYCGLKITLIDYAFHESAYFAISLLIMVVYFLYSFAALGFQLGPLQFLFYDYMPLKHRSLYDQARTLCARFATTARYYALQRLVDVPLTEDVANARHVIPVVTAASAATAKCASGFSHVNIVFGCEIAVNIGVWNKYVAQQWAGVLVAEARTSAIQIDAVGGVRERRFVVLMQFDGLLLAVYLLTPTATLMSHLRTPSATPIELVVRCYGVDSDRSTNDHKTSFMYAESPLLVGRLGVAQKNALLQLLVDFNQHCGVAVDVPLRSLRCKNFVDAGLGRVKKRKARTSRAFVSDFDGSFGA